jgi:hypothetical protein
MQNGYAVVYQNLRDRLNFVSYSLVSKDGLHSRRAKAGFL